MGMMKIGAHGDVLIPCCLNAVLRVLAHREELARKFRFLLPDEHVLRRVNDKWELYKLAAELQIPTPKTYCPEDERDAYRVAEGIDYPAIVKLRHDENLYAGPGGRYAKVQSPGELVEAWRRFHELQGRPIVQEYIRGVSYGYECLHGPDGRLLAELAHQRLVEYPASGGPSAVCESVREPRLLEMGRKLMSALGWRGVAMAQFVRCGRGGEFFLLEVNPRFWGSLPLAEAAGVNFPYLLWLAAIGETVEAHDGRAGVRTRLLPMYLLGMWGCFRGRPWAIGDWGPKLRFLFDPRVREGMFCLDDLRPAFRYFIERMGGA